MTKFPQELDGDNLFEVDNETDILAAHHNALKDAIKALEEKVGIDLSAIETSFDYILANMVIKSDPPDGCKRVVNLYYDPNEGLAGKYAMEREE